MLTIKNKIITAVLSVVLVCGLGVSVVLPQVSKPKRAIIVMPGLIANGLMDATTEEPLWEPFVSEYSLNDFFSDKMMDMVIHLAMREDVRQLLNDILENNPKSFINQILMDEDGNAVNDYVVAVPSDYKYNQRYGALQNCRGMYEAMETRYGHEADVVMFNYDWRQDNRISARQLEEFINKKGYDEVVLCAHSMGNMVSTLYMARSEDNRNKVLAHLSYGGPYYGALMALSVLEDPEGMFEGMVFGLRAMNNPFITSVVNKIEEQYYNQFLPLILNTPTIAQLLPTYELLKSEQYAEGESFVCLDGTMITDQSDLINYYKSRPWSFKSDGHLRKFVDELDDYFDAFYVDDGSGNKVHVSTLVNTLYFAGNEVRTEHTVYIDDDNEYDHSGYDKLGDGTVPVYSAIVGKNMTDKNVMIMNGYDHFGCGCNFVDELAIPSYRFLDKTLEEANAKAYLKFFKFWEK